MMFLVSLTFQLLLISISITFAFQFQNACIARDEYVTLLPGFENFTVSFFYRAFDSGPLISFQNDTNSTCFSIGIGTGNNAPLDPQREGWHFASIVVNVGGQLNINGVFRDSISSPPCVNGFKAFIGCAHVNGNVRFHANATIANLRIFSYALQQSDLDVVKGFKLDPDKTCGLEIDNALLSFADISSTSGFVSYPSLSSGTRGLRELTTGDWPSLSPASTTPLSCPASVELACARLTCGNCALHPQNRQKQCKLCDNLTCRPATTSCPRLFACPAATDEFCATFFEKCTSVCQSDSISICKCAADVIHLQCPAPGFCSMPQSNCLTRCAVDEPVTSCDCNQMQLVGCGSKRVSLAPPTAPAPTPLSSANIIAIAIGVGGGVFCICIIVVIILIVKAYRARKVTNNQVAPHTEAISLNTLGVNMSSVRSARPSIATEPVFACSFCPQKFMTSEELQSHMPTHNSNKNSEYGELSVVSAVEYDRVELSTNGEMLREVRSSSVAPVAPADFLLTRDSRHAEPALDPSLPGYSTKPDEFAKFQIND
jgi:hypothetical protein